MLEILEDYHLKQLETIRHGFFTRLGGVSEGIYASLNCAYPSHDNPDNVRENRRRVMSHFGLGLESLVTARNIHSNIVATVEAPWSEDLLPQADGIVTKLSEIVLGSDSADCPIVLFADKQNGVIGLAHAGWRGAKSGILQATVNRMIALGGRCENILAAISPCIAQTSYEVSNEFYQQFLEEDIANQSYFIKAKKADHFFFNLLGYVRDCLLNLNLRSVSSEVAFDTYVDERRFFSCRRAMHKGEVCFGGHFSCISMTRV